MCMIAGLILVPVVSLMTPRMNALHVDSIFACYDRQVTVTVKDSIGEKAN